MNNLKILLFSQNTIERNTEPLRITDTHDNHIFNIETPPDIIVEMTQEDSRHVLKPIINSESIKYTSYNISLNTLGGIDKNVIMQVYVRDIPELRQLQVKKGKISLMQKKHNSTVKYIFSNIGNSFYATKGAVYIHLSIPGFKPILFVNMHLPIDTKKEDFGNEHRVNSLNKIIENLKSKFKLESNIYFLGGDMNFRIVEKKNIVSGQESKKYEDQLTEYLKTNNYNLRELNMSLNPPIFTCKFDTQDENCRTTPIPQPFYENLNKPNQNISNNGISEVNKIQQTCGNPHRPPSRCDRFLISGSEGYATIDKYEGIFIKELPSDHNAIYSLITLNRETSGGKNHDLHLNKLKKYTKQKTNYKRKTTYKKVRISKQKKYKKKTIKRLRKQ
jgi:hypothetical protein